jgi:hypothetical protein
MAVRFAPQGEDMSQHTGLHRWPIIVGLIIGLAAASVAASDASPPARLRGTLWVTPVDLGECNREGAVARGDAVLLTGNGLTANATIALTFLQGDSEHALDSTRSNAHGAISARAVIPMDAQVGQSALIRASDAPGNEGAGVILNSAPLQIFADGRDTDGDGIKDMCDNCPTMASTDLTDMDGDELGDACDPCPTDPENGAGSGGRCADDNANPQVPLSQPAH